MKPKTRILLVDDHSVVRMGLAAIINIAKDLVVCGEAENGEDAVARASQLKPDVVVMDLMMPGMSGAEATAAVLKASPESK
ncbi:MAG: response regulator transcription factor, partial [Kiritimatiellae bacterium]|nr:response regulator transcription factor [Kiritimatiellia bacterium]